MSPLRWRPWSATTCSTSNRIFRRPHTTVIGYENNDKLAWVQRMAQTTEPEEAALALSVISDGISAGVAVHRAGLAHRHVG